MLEVEDINRRKQTLRKQTFILAICIYKIY